MSTGLAMLLDMMAEGKTRPTEGACREAAARIRELETELETARTSDTAARMALRAWSGSLDTLVRADVLERLDEGGIHVTGPAWVVAEVTRLRADLKTAAKEMHEMFAQLAAACAGRRAYGERVKAEMIRLAWDTPRDEVMDALHALDLSALEDKP